MQVQVGNNPTIMDEMRTQKFGFIENPTITVASQLSQFHNFVSYDNLIFYCIIYNLNY
jgi:hypothetical protein